LKARTECAIQRHDRLVRCMTTHVRFGLKLGQDASVAELRDVWRIADEAEFDHLWCLDLFATIGADGPDREIFEGWALLAGMAVATKRVRIGTAFTGNTHRPPWLLAKLAVTVDHLSGGRLEFGVGAGYEELQHRMFAIDLEHRVGRLAESLECLKLLWTQNRVDFDGRYYRLRDAIANPKPVQEPHPPIWMGGGGDLMLRLAAQHADVWNCSFRGVDSVNDSRAMDQYKAAVEKLNGFCAQIGRDPTTIKRLMQIRWNGTDPGPLLASCAAWLQAGCTEQIIYLDSQELDPPGIVLAAEATGNLLPELRKLASAVG
jgi:alkanesulfonate monooxygenase SsuD/methylene tetrahydromethanopterin reductase-like flavin-dependent oxidoreductase (luciferase family)